METTMTYQEILQMDFAQATEIMKGCDPTGKRSLLRGCEEVKATLNSYDCWDEAPVSFQERQAFRIVCREMSKLFV
jgi:hypothetical protein